MNTNGLLMNRFVELIEANHQEITERFMNDLLSNPDTLYYKKIDRQAIYEMGDKIYRELSTFIKKDYPKELIADHYKRIARERFSQGIPLSQVFKALVLLKRHLWIYVQSKLTFDLADYKQALDLNNRVVLYFDRGAFYCLQGYEEMSDDRW